MSSGKDTIGSISVQVTHQPLPYTCSAINRLDVTIDDSSIEQRPRSRPRSLPHLLQCAVDQLNATHEAAPTKPVTLDDLLLLVNAVQEFTKAWPLAERSLALEKIKLAIWDQGRGVTVIPVSSPRPLPLRSRKRTTGTGTQDRTPMIELMFLQAANAVLDRIKRVAPGRRRLWSRRLDALLERAGHKRSTLEEHRRNLQRRVGRARAERGARVLKDAMQLPPDLITVEQQLERLLAGMEQTCAATIKMDGSVNQDG